MIVTASLELELTKQEDLSYGWKLSRPNGRVVERGAEAYVSSCVAAAAGAVDPSSRIKVSVDGVPGGVYAAVRMQLEPIDVAAEIAQAVLVKPGGGFSHGAA